MAAIMVVVVVVVVMIPILCPLGTAKCDGREPMTASQNQSLRVEQSPLGLVPCNRDHTSGNL